MIKYILLSFILLLAYAFWIEPNWIEVNTYTLKENISSTLKIAHLSDLHIRSLKYRESKILVLLEQEKPDVIFITGDLIAENANYEAVKVFLKKLHAPLGVWLVKGNWEHWRPSAKENEVYEAAGVKCLNNSAKRLKNEIWVAGTDDELAGAPDLPKSIKDIPKNAFIISLFHSPAFFEGAAPYFHLAFAGHTHGGQIRLPFLSPLWLPAGSGRFVSGWYTSGKSKMHVSKGLGNSIIDARFLCRPEIAIVNVQKEDE